MYRIYKWLSGKKLSIVLFWFLSVLYYFLFIIRKLLYRLGFKKSRSLPCQVISVGNISWGGTGKTPLVEFLVRKFKSKKVIVLSRGYGRKKEKGRITLVSDGNRILAGAEEAGDEARHLAKKLPGTPVIAGKDRVLSGKWAIGRFQPQVIILDDGFQHWSLKRNLDLVVIDSTNPFGNRWLIPAGILREPLRELSRAELIFLSKVNEANLQIDKLKEEIKKFNPHAPIVEAIFEPEGFYLWPKGEIKPKEFIRKKSVLMLAGLGSPNSFRHSLLQLGADLKGELIYPDHYYYRTKDLAKAINLAKLKKAEFIVTTEKDEVKLPKVLVNFPILVLKIKVRIVKGEEVLDARLS